MTVRFIEFVRLHAQNASLFLGKVPHPQTGQPQVNLEVARMLVEQLAAIAYKTRGNLTSEEQNLLDKTLTGLQQSLAEATQNARPSDPGADGWRTV